MSGIGTPHDCHHPKIRSRSTAALLVLQQRFVVEFLSSLVVGVFGAGLVAAAQVGPGGDAVEGTANAVDHVCQETANLAWAEGDQVAAAFGSVAAVTAR